MSREARQPLPRSQGAGGPMRPARSELRSRLTSQNSTSVQMPDQDKGRSAHTKALDSTDQRHRAAGDLISVPRYPNDETDDEVQEVQDDHASPVLNSVVAAFQKGTVKRDDTPRIIHENQRDRNQRGDKIPKSQTKQFGHFGNQRKLTKSGDVDAVLDQIEEGWAFVAQSEFNPVDLALSLLDDSSVGQNMDSFRRTKKMLENALRGTVDKHFQSFAAALPRHASTESSLTNAQQEIKNTRVMLLHTRDTLGTKRSDLVQLWSRGQALEEMVRLLDEIDLVKAVPDALESLISEKRWLHASMLLMRSLKITGKVEMMEIGALSDLRSYLVAQEGALKDMLIEELQAHIYLKVFWTDSRWAPYLLHQQTLPVVETESDPTVPMTEIPDASLPPPRLTRYLNGLSLRLNKAHSQEALDNADLFKIGLVSSAEQPQITANNGVSTSLPEKQQTIDPESDSFTYIETLIESLDVLGKLTVGLDSIVQRLSTEIYTITEGTADEVGERSQYGLRQTSQSTAAHPRSFGPTQTTPIVVSSDAQILTPTSLRLSALESVSREDEHEVLRDFFWTLYSKLDAVLQALRVAYDVSKIVISRRDSKEGSPANADIGFPLSDLWLPIYAEMRALLKVYLAGEETGAIAGRNPLASIADVLRESKYARDRNKPPFRLVDTDGKTVTKVLKRHENELSRVLNAFVPGLVNNHLTDSGPLAVIPSFGMEDRFSGANAHRLLVKPNPFHVTILFQPTLAFIERACQVMPDSSIESATATASFLDEFVLNIYLPQLQEKVFSLFQQGVSRPDAFEEDQLSLRLSSKPLAKACVYLMALVNSLCSLQRATPFHRENYALLVLNVIIRFYQGCYHQFLDLVTAITHGGQVESGLSISASLAQKKELMACLAHVFNADEADKNRIYREEVDLVLTSLVGIDVHMRDLITIKNLSALGLLYHTLSWLVTQLRNLSVVSTDPIISPVEQVLLPVQTLSATKTRVARVQSERIELLLTATTALQYDALLQTYEQLAELVLYTIKLDIRCRTVHFLDLTVKEGNYQLDSHSVEPDPNIIDLNMDLALCEDAVIATLPKRQRGFIFEGIGLFMEQALIYDSRHIRFINLMGVEKMLRNVVALQQNLKTLVEVSSDQDLARARMYYELLMLTPQIMLSSLEQPPSFSLDEYKSILRLQCGADLPRDASGQNAEFERCIIQLETTYR